MRRFLEIYRGMLTAVLLVMSVGACTDDDLVKTAGEVVEGVPVTVSLSLSFVPAADVVVTRASGNDFSELSNLVLFIYSGDGNTLQKIVRTSDNSLTLGTGTELTSTGSTGMCYSISFETTSGTKKLLAVANTSSVAADGGFWESLSDIATSASNGEVTFDELKSSIIHLRSGLYTNTEMQPIQIISASQMLMSGWNEGVQFGTDGRVSNYGTRGDATNSIIVKLDRSMAHITFNIPANPAGASGTFTPTSYRVYNIPVNSYLAYTKETPAATEGEGFVFVHSASMNVGSVSDGQYSFNFYMPENIHAVKQITAYGDRDKWKGETGALPEEKTWENAPQNSTFVVISGTYENETGGLTGSVQYTVHLGDFSDTGSMGNFSVERNGSYTYNLSVLGVDRIIVEAEKETDGGEYQQGAEGDIFNYDDTRYAYHLDAHYEQVYLRYNLSQIANSLTQGLTDDEAIDDAIADRLILVIQSDAMDYTHADDGIYSVQNKRGTLRPYKIYRDAMRANNEEEKAKKAVLDGNGDGQSGFDYKWVEFWPQAYSANNTTLAEYPGVSNWSKETISDLDNTGAYGGRAVGNNGALLDVYDVIVAMGNVVKMIYQGTMPTEYAYYNSNNTDGIRVSRQGSSYRGYTYYACFTAFVNEYYYYKHPLTHKEISWDFFTNKIPREMIIAMDTQESTDGNSSYSNLYSYISQASIQTFYHSGIDAFGMETYNETPLCLWAYGNYYRAGESSTDGWNNQLTLLNLGGNSDVQWETYIDYENNGWTTALTSEHNVHKLNGAYAYGSNDWRDGTAYAYYACLSRNRDLNGDGNIDKNEVRWYLPALNEYIRMSIGNSAISNASRLYQGDKMAMTYDGYPGDFVDEGSLYYTSSANDERVFWAVERGSYSAINTWTGYGDKPIRCVRMLPSMADDHDISTVEDVPAESTFERIPNSSPITLKFKDRLVNDLYRQRTDGFLSHHTEDDAANSFYEGIFVAKEFLEGTYTLGDIVGYTGSTLNWQVWNDNTGWSFYRYPDDDNGVRNPCAGYEEGGYSNWRVPNLVELSAMNAAGLLPINDVGCCTQFSNVNVRHGFTFASWINCPGPSDAGFQSQVRIRCVRDVPAGYFE